MENKNQEQLERQRAWVIHVLYWGLLLLSIFFGGKLLLPVLLPFAVAYGLAWALDRPIQRLSDKTHLPRELSALLCVLLLTLFSGGLLLLLGAGVTAGLRSVAGFAPERLERELMNALAGLFAGMERWMDRAPPAWEHIIAGGMKELFGLLRDAALRMSGALLTLLGNWLKALPGLFMQVLVTMIAAVFLAGDFPHIRQLLHRLLPQRARPYLQEAGRFFGRTLPRCAGAYLLLFLLTTGELTVGFWLLHIPGAPIAALLTALLDILPVLGTGTVLLPWAVLAFWQRRGALGGGLLLLYGVVTVLRQWLEPKILGKQIQIHPLLTFFGMLLGLRLLGIWGLILLPMGLAFCRQLWEKELLPLHLPEEP